MEGAAGNANHVSGFDFDGDDIAFQRMDVEDAAAGDDEADFVLVVGVLGAEFGEHGVETRSFGVDVDDVGGGVVALRLHGVDLGGIGAEDGIGFGINSYAIERPALIVNSNRSQSGRDFALFVENDPF